jgi:hypothetical protein
LSHKIFYKFFPRNVLNDCIFLRIYEYAMDNESQKRTTVSYAVIAIVAALALLGIVAITVVTIPQQQEAEAAGCKNSIAFNASKGRCFRP